MAFGGTNPPFMPPHPDPSGHSIEIVKQVAEVQIKKTKEVITETYGQAINYSNIIILAGYAGLFTMLTNMKDVLPKVNLAWCRFLMTISVIIFVGFEVYKMMYLGLFFRKVLTEILEKSPGTVDVVEEIRKVQKSFNAKFQLHWLWFAIPAIVTGFGSALILVVTFVKSILSIIL